MSRDRVMRRKEAVLICTPHKIDYEVDVRTPEFIAKAMGRGIAAWHRTPAKVPECARNGAIQDFLTLERHSKHTHLFFCDMDSPPENDYAIERLLSHNKDVVAGVTPIVLSKDTSFSCFWSCLLKKENTFDHISVDELPKTLFKAERVGGTCLLISRKALEALEPPYQKTDWKPNYMQVERSEDYYFADKIREAGFDIWVDPTVQCHHFHKFDFLELFSIYNQMKEKCA